MNTISQKISLAILAVVSFAMALPAHAVVVPYTVDGVTQQLTAPTPAPVDAPWGANGYPGDTVTLQSYSGTFDLSLGTSIQKINSLLWTVNYTYGGTATDANAWSDVSFTLNGTRDIHIGTASATLDQTGSLTASWDNDYLGFAAGSTSTIFYDGYKIDITPVAIPSAGATSFDGDNPWVQPSQDVYAQFVVSVDPGVAAAPEPGSIAALIGLVAFTCGGSAVSRLRSKK